VEDEKKMKALVFVKPRRLEWEERPEPAAGPGEAVVETRAVGICGSDLHGYTGESSRRTPGNPMGHEATGQVVALGPEVPADWLGRRVAIFPILACGQCDQCLGGHIHRCRKRRFLGNNVVGAMAERLALPVANLHPLPEAMSCIQGVLAEPLAVAIHAVRMAGDLAGRTVLIAGGGPIGLLTLMAAREHGAKAVALTVRTPERRELAKALGAAVAVDPTREGWRQEVAEGLGAAEVDLAFDAAGIQPTFEQCMETVTPGGTIVQIGSWSSLKLNLSQLAPREISVVGSFNYTADEFGEAVEWLAAGRVDPSPLVSAVRPLAEGAAAFEELAQHPSRFLRIVLTSGSIG
jgi:2-desacetyl-2-hydroxyethyl bacteriochlorophyllide A dehydrogenase